MCEAQLEYPLTCPATRPKFLINSKGLDASSLLGEYYLTLSPGADRESDGWGGAPLAVTGLFNIGKAWLFLDF